MSTCKRCGTPYSQPDTKGCHACYMREWGRKNPEQRAKNNAASYQRNLEARRQDQKQRARRERKEHPERVQERQRRHQAEQRDKFRRIIAKAKDSPCVDCGIELPPVAMDLDHVRGEKRFNFGSFHKASAIPGKTREETLRAEIAKCEVRCANCHRLRHHSDTI